MIICLVLIGIKRFLLHMEKREDASRCRAFIPKPKTNADRIRAMTDEELSDYFSELSCWPNAGREDCRGMENCMDCWLDWLKQEVNT